MHTEPVIAVDLHPWHVSHYAALTTPLSLEAALRSLATVDRDTRALHRLGDERALQGAATLRTVAILGLIAAPARTRRELKTKVECLSALSDTLKPAWLIRPMLHAAIETDARRLGLTPNAISRMRAALDATRKRRS